MEKSRKLRGQRTFQQGFKPANVCLKNNNFSHYALSALVVKKKEALKGIREQVKYQFSLKECFSCVKQLRKHAL